MFLKRTIWGRFIIHILDGVNYLDRLFSKNDHSLEVKAVQVYPARNLKDGLPGLLEGGGVGDRIIDSSSRLPLAGLIRDSFFYFECHQDWVYREMADLYASSGRTTDLVGLFFWRKPDSLM